MHDTLTECWSVTHAGDNTHYVYALNRFVAVPSNFLFLYQEKEICQNLFFFTLIVA